MTSPKVVLKVKGRVPRRWMPPAVPSLEDQFLVGLLDEGLEEPTLEFEADLMDKRLDPVGEMRVVVGQGQGHLEPEFERERLPLAVDGAEGACGTGRNAWSGHDHILPTGSSAVRGRGSQRARG